MKQFIYFRRFGILLLAIALTLPMLLAGCGQNSSQTNKSEESSLHSPNQDACEIFVADATQSFTLLKNEKRDNFAEIRPLIGISALPEKEREALWKEVMVTQSTGSKVTAESVKARLLPILEALEMKTILLPSFPEETRVNLSSICAEYIPSTNQIALLDFFYIVGDPTIGTDREAIYRVFVPINEEYMAGLFSYVSDESVYEGSSFRVANYVPAENYKNFAYSNPVVPNIPGEKCLIHIGRSYPLEYHIGVLEQMSFVPAKELIYPT